MRIASGGEMTTKARATSLRRFAWGGTMGRSLPVERRASKRNKAYHHQLLSSRSGAYGWAIS
jgi:hypothetical protein